MELVLFAVFFPYALVVFSCVVIRLNLAGIPPTLPAMHSALLAFADSTEGVFLHLSFLVGLAYFMSKTKNKYLTSSDHWILVLISTFSVVAFVYLQLRRLQ